MLIEEKYKGYEVSALYTVMHSIFDLISLYFIWSFVVQKERLKKLSNGNYSQLQEQNLVNNVVKDQQKQKLFDDRNLAKIYPINNSMDSSRAEYNYEKYGQKRSNKVSQRVKFNEELDDSITKRFKMKRVEEIVRQERRQKEHIKNLNYQAMGMHLEDIYRLGLIK
eukprot:403376295